MPPEHDDIGAPQGAMAPATLESLAARLAGLAPRARRLVALAGPPGAGKSTAAVRLEALMTGHGLRPAVLQMDGFHFDDAVLGPRGLLPRKGAPETFDTAGFVAILARIAAPAPAPVAVPVFDRSLELSRAAARIVPSEVDWVIVEGNYLLLDHPDWRPAARFFDVTVRLSVSEPTLRARLMQRWLDAGLPEREARRKTEENDLPNGLQVLHNSRPADFVIDSEG